MFTPIHNIRRSIINQDLFKLSDNFINDDSENLFLSEYFGKVINNVDPEKLGRCQIRILTLFSDTIKDDELPWAIPDFSFIGSTVGSFVVPLVNTIVKVYFDGGSIYHPVYTSKGLNENSLPDSKDTNYPDNMVLYTTDDGEVFSVNRSTKLTKLHHSSGTELSVDSNGNILIDTKLSSKNGNVTINVNGDALIDVNKTATINAKVSATVKSPIIDVNGGKVTINNSGACVVGGIPGTGPFNCLPIDPITGATHQSNFVINQGQGI
jgi:hypothetical protein